MIRSSARLYDDLESYRRNGVGEGRARAARAALLRRARSPRWGGEAREQLWRVWLAAPEGDAEAWLILRRFAEPARAGSARPASLIALRHPDALRPAHRGEVLACAVRGAHPVARAARRLIADGPDELRDAVCEAALGIPGLTGLCVAEGVFPADPARRAVFALLTGQLAQYEAGDPDGALLAAGYAAALADERRRVREALAETGRGDLLRTLAAADPRPAPGSAETRHLASRLRAVGDTDGLLGLALRLPLDAAVEAVQGSSPPAAHDDPRYRLLRAADPSAVRRARRRLTGGGTDLPVPGRPHSASFAPDGSGIAVLAGEYDDEGRDPGQLSGLVLRHFPLPTGRPVTLALRRGQAVPGEASVLHTGRSVALADLLGISVYDLEGRPVHAPELGAAPVVDLWNTAEHRSLYGLSPLMPLAFPAPGGCRVLQRARGGTHETHLAHHGLVRFDDAWRERGRRAVRSGEWSGRPYGLYAEPDGENAAAANADASLLAWVWPGPDHGVLIHDPATGRTELTAHLTGRAEPPRSVCFTDRHTVACLHTGGLRTYTLTSAGARPRAERALAVEAVGDLVLFDGLLVTTDRRRLRAFDPVTLQDAEPPALPDGFASVTGLWADPSGTRLAVGGHGGLRVYAPYDGGSAAPYDVGSAALAVVPLADLAPRHVREIDAALAGRAGRDTDVRAFLRLLRDCALARTGDAVALSRAHTASGPYDVAVRPAEDRP
ncbi:hypothetical protein AB0M28_04720 [Streptomyces sp. NPDC051940]|uniref:hypothetical protein n=1 Tax=Streptomyces sp. NPDC051940 TaxID=3155675 RepID=UPI00341FC85D